MKKFLLLLVAMVCTFVAKAADPSDVTVLLNTDFTVFTDGSEESPQDLYSSTFNSKVDGYYMVSSVASAGGQLLVKSSGYLTLNSFSDLPSSGACVRITAKVYMIGFDGLIQFQPTYSSTTNVMVEADKWVDIEVLVPDITRTSRLKILPFLSVSGFYIKSLKVEYSPDFVAAPEAYLPTDATGTSFTASCSVYSGINKYEADVFTLDADNNPVYFAQNVELKKLSAYSTMATAKITDLDPSETYYYVARSVNDNGTKSADSEVVKVVKSIASIDAPEALEATEITATGFTANWNQVDNAASYLVNVFSRTTLSEESTISIFKEDFSGVKNGTPSNLEYNGDLNDYTNVKGWETDMSKTFAAGYYVFYPINETGVLTTPAINLSGSEGKFQVVLTAATRAYNGFAASEDTLEVELVDADGNVVETAGTKTIDQSDLAEYTFDFTKGIANGRLRITFTKVNGSSMKLFLDDVDVLQSLPAGSVVDTQLTTATTDKTSCTIEIDLEEGVEYGYTVIAIGETVVGSGANAQIGTVESDASNRISVRYKSSGIETVANGNSAKAWKEADGVLRVTGSDIVVADIAGTVLLHNATDVEQTFTVNHKGIVIVRVDGQTYKFAL